MKAKLTMSLDNAIFDNDLQGELSRIFTDLADRIKYGKINDPYIIRDINGNVIGKFEIKK